MIRRMAAATLTFSLMLTGPALAQEVPPKEPEPTAFRSKSGAYFALHAGISEPELTDVEGVRLRDGGTFSIGGGFRLAGPLLLDLDVLNTSSRPDGFVFDDPDERLSVTSFGAGLTLDPAEGRFRPYIGAGLGLGAMEQSYDYSRGYYYDGIYYPDYDDYYYEDQYTSFSLMVTAKAGVRVFFTPGVALDIQARHQEAEGFETEAGAGLPYAATSYGVGLSVWGLGF